MYRKSWYRKSWLLAAVVASSPVWCGGASAQFIGSEPRTELWTYEYCSGPDCAPPVYGYSGPPPMYGYAPPVYGYSGAPPVYGYDGPAVYGYSYPPYSDTRDEPRSNACYTTCVIEYNWQADQCRYYCRGRP
jgi:hypothetical protein